MAHWAEIDENNTVVRVLVTDNNDPAGDEGYQWLIENLGGTWVKTSYNTVEGLHVNGGSPFRKNYAGIGYTYDSQRDAFIPPKPDDIIIDGVPRDIVFDEETCTWRIETSIEE